MPVTPCCLSITLIHPISSAHVYHATGRQQHHDQATIHRLHRPPARLRPTLGLLFHWPRQHILLSTARYLVLPTASNMYGTALGGRRYTSHQMPNGPRHRERPGSICMRPGDHYRSRSLITSRQRLVLLHFPSRSPLCQRCSFNVGWGKVARQAGKLVSR